MGCVVVCGANRGIGLGLCRLLSAQGHEVIALCRQGSEALNQLGIQVETGIDVTDANCTKKANEALANVDKIDTYIHVAGIRHVENLNDMNFTTMTKQFEVNSLGPIRMSLAMVSRMSTGSKIAILTSRMGSIEDNSSGGRYGYRMSKAALNAGAKSLAVDLKDQGISVAIVHPGLVATDMTNFKGIAVDESCLGIIKCIDQLSLNNSGHFWHADGSILPW